MSGVSQWLAILIVAVVGLLTAFAVNLCARRIRQLEDRLADIRRHVALLPSRSLKDQPDPSQCASDRRHG